MTTPLCVITAVIKPNGLAPAMCVHRAVAQPAAPRLPQHVWPADGSAITRQTFMAENYYCAFSVVVPCIQLLGIPKDKKVSTSVHVTLACNFLTLYAIRYTLRS